MVNLLALAPIEGEISVIQGLNYSYAYVSLVASRQVAHVDHYERIYLHQRHGVSQRSGLPEHL